MTALTVPLEKSSLCFIGARFFSAASYISLYVISFPFFRFYIRPQNAATHMYPDRKTRFCAAIRSV